MGLKLNTNNILKPNTIEQSRYFQISITIAEYRFLISFDVNA